MLYQKFLYTVHFCFWHIYKSDCSDTVISEILICLNQKILLIFATFMDQSVLICYIRISDMLESKNSTRFGHIYKSDCSDTVISEFLMCLNQKILHIFGTFMNQTVLICYIRISDMF